MVEIEKNKLVSLVTQNVQTDPNNSNGTIEVIEVAQQALQQADTDTIQQQFDPDLADQIRNPRIEQDRESLKGALTGSLIALSSCSLALLGGVSMIMVDPNNFGLVYGGYLVSAFSSIGIITFFIFVCTFADLMTSNPRQEHQAELERIQQYWRDLEPVEIDPQEFGTRALALLAGNQTENRIRALAWTGNPNAIDVVPDGQLPEQITREQAIRWNHLANSDREYSQLIENWTAQGGNWEELQNKSSDEAATILENFTAVKAKIDQEVARYPHSPGRPNLRRLLWAAIDYKQRKQEIINGGQPLTSNESGELHTITENRITTQTRINDAFEAAQHEYKHRTCNLILVGHLGRDTFLAVLNGDEPLTEHAAQQLQIALQTYNTNQGE